KPKFRSKDELNRFLRFGGTVGTLATAIRQNGRGGPKHVREALLQVWTELKRVSEATQIRLSVAARSNILKRANRWPSQPKPLPVFDDGYPYEEQLPRRLRVEFLERKWKDGPVVVLRING